MSHLLKLPHGPRIERLARRDPEQDPRPLERPEDRLGERLQHADLVHPRVAEGTRDFLGDLLASLPAKRFIVKGRNS